MKEHARKMKQVDIQRRISFSNEVNASRYSYSCHALHPNSYTRNSKSSVTSFPTESKVLPGLDPSLPLSESLSPLRPRGIGSVGRGAQGQ